MGGVVASGHEVGTPANKRRCHNKRHGEDDKIAKAMATMEEDAAGVGTVAAGWVNEDNKARYRTTWDSKSWGP
jgi:hypothetical protein